MKLAKYKHLQHEYTTIDKSGWMDGADSGYVRLTEFVEVEFTDLPAEVTVPQEVAALEKAKEAAAVKYQGIVSTIDDKISKLLAITHEEL